MIWLEPSLTQLFELFKRGAASQYQRWNRREIGPQSCDFAA